MTEMIYSVSAVPCHLLSKYRIKLKSPLLAMIRKRSSISEVPTTTVLIISAPIKISKPKVKYPDKYLVDKDG